MFEQIGIDDTKRKADRSPIKGDHAETLSPGDHERTFTAKMISTDPGQPPQADPETRTRLMTRLLEDRFKLKMHFEDRVVPAYTLSAVKPKLTKADPATRSGCH